MDEALLKYIPENFDITKYETKNLTLERWGENLLYRKRVLDNVIKFGRKRILHRESPCKSLEEEVSYILKNPLKCVFVCIHNGNHLRNTITLGRALHYTAVDPNNKEIPVERFNRRRAPQTIRGSISDLKTEDIITVNKVGKRTYDVSTKLKSPNRLLCTIDITQSDEQLVNDFKEWLKIKR